MKLWHRLAFLAAIPLILQCFLLNQVKVAQEELDRAYVDERKQKDVMILIGKAVKTGMDSLSDIVSYKSAHRPLKKERAAQHVQEMRKLSEEMALLSGSQPHLLRVQSVLSEIEETVQSAMDEDVNAVNLRDLSKTLQFTKLGRKAFSIMEYAQVQQEMKYKQMLVIVQAKRRHFDEMAMQSALLCAFVTFGIAGYVIYLTSKQLQVLKRNSENLARGEELLPPMRGTDELADVDRTFHLMAQSIHQLSERERAILRNSSEWIFAIDSKLRFSFVSDAVEKLLGYKPDELLGQHAANLLGGSLESIEKARTALVDQIFETSVKHKQEHEVEVQISVHWSQTDQTFFCVAHDIGARKDLERMKQSFMAMVSHDLRTPVSANLLTLDLLKSDPAIGTLSDRGVNLVDRSIASNNRLMYMINDLLELERLDSGQMTLEMELVTFNDLVDETLPGVEMLAKAKEITIERDDSDQFIYCESGRIVQVLVNLVGNAIKFSPHGKTVRVRYASQDGYSSILVIDEGPGIDKESLPHIFDRFKQVKEASGAHKQGFGLGLEICKKLVELHGGSISVISEVGTGTTFEIRLPERKV